VRGIKQKMGNKYVETKRFLIRQEVGGDQIGEIWKVGKENFPGQK